MDNYVDKTRDKRNSMEYFEQRVITSTLYEEISCLWTAFPSKIIASTLLLLIYFRVSHNTLTTRKLRLCTGGRPIKWLVGALSVLVLSAGTSRNRFWKHTSSGHVRKWNTTLLLLRTWFYSSCVFVFKDHTILLRHMTVQFSRVSEHFKDFEGILVMTTSNLSF